MTDPLLRFREEFPVTESCVYLNHAAIAPLPRRSVERMKALVDQVSRTGDRHWPDRNNEVERVRGLAAQLLGARDPREVAFVDNTSTGLSYAAAGFDWRPGDNVVGADFEFPSNVYPWMQLADRGVEYRRVPERDGRIDPDELLSRVDDRTRMLVLSSVQYASGFRSDLPRLGAACRERGILFVVDAIQSLGGLAHDVEREKIDILAAASHKWLLGLEGSGLLYVSDRVVDRIRPVRSGWRSMRNLYDWTDLKIDWNEGARRFESGTLNPYSIAALGGALEIFLEAVPDAIEKRVLALANRTAEGLAAQGFHVISSRRPGETSGIIAATHPRIAAGELVKRLADRDVIVAERAGRFRVSAHFYNMEAEVDRMLEAVADCTAYISGS